MEAGKLSSRGPFVQLSLEAQDSLWLRKPLFDYDCVTVRPPGLVDWAVLHENIQKSVDIAHAGGQLPRPPPLSGRVFFNHRLQALEECPLAVLTLAVLHFYTAMQEDDLSPGRQEVLTTAEQVANSIFHVFSMHQICASRWPIFELLEILAPRGPMDSSYTCEEAGKGSLVNWSYFRRMAVALSELKLFRVSSKAADDLEQEAFSLILHVLRSEEKAQAECVFGYVFAVGSQALSAATRLTQHFTHYSELLDQFVRTFGFRVLAGSGWPIFSSLAWLSDANKGDRYVKRDPKYLRRFGDMDLRAAELSPMVAPPGRGDVAASNWRSRGARRSAFLARLPQHRFEHVINLRMKRVPMRPILQRALKAVISATRAGVTFTMHVEGRRAVALTLLYGESWSPLLGRIIKHFRNLEFTWTVLVVSIGDSAALACQEVSRESVGLPPPQVACWSPPTASQMNRFTIIHILLHLGVDVFFFDMDTFFFRNPLPSIAAKAKHQRLDALFASHGDGDCINIGIFFIRSTFKSAAWFSQFLEWYHEHQYEIDQRGLDVLLRSPRRIETSELGVSFAPRALAQLRVSALEDANEFVIGFIGWAGDVARLVVFHWCNLPLERKWRELAEVYDAAEALKNGLPLGVALSIAAPGWKPESRAASVDPPDAPFDATIPNNLGATWSLVRRARRIFEAYRLPTVPERTPCW